MSSLGDEHPMSKTSLIFKSKSQIVSQFYPAYNRMRLFEGNYTHQLHDKGGETYGGVTRNWNKDWYAWKYIDQHRKKLKQNYLVPEAEFWVMDYYLDVWVKEGFYKIQNQDVANYLFDFRINSWHSSTKITQRMLIEMGSDIDITGKLDQATIDAVNNVDPDLFLIKLRDNRIKFYKKIVHKNPTQKRFYKAWVNRANVIKSSSEKI